MLSNKSKAKSLKIGYSARPRKYAPNYIFNPKITLAGAYLRKAGFEIGQQVNVEIQHGRIQIISEGGIND